MTSVSTTTSSSVTGANAGRPPILGIHHPALRCRDAEETRHFYEDILGLQRTAACIFDEPVPGQKMDFMHIFFRMAEGDFVAFFDVPPLYNPDIFAPFDSTDLRVALKVSGDVELKEMQDRLSAAGVEYTGPVDHGFIKSIYFTDPNGIHLEVAAISPNHDQILAAEKGRARSVLDAWIAENCVGEAVN